MNVEDEEDELGTLVRDPAVREAVFDTVTVSEAHRIIHSRRGKPWCDAFMVTASDGIDGWQQNDPAPDSIGDAARKVLGLPQSFARKEEQP